MLRKLTEEEQAANKAAVGRMLRLYKALFGIPAAILLIVAFTLIGYAKGYLDGYLARPTIFQKDKP